MSYHTGNIEYKENTDFPENEGRKKLLAYLFGLLLIAASIFIGKSYLFYLAFLGFSFSITFLWRNNYRPWIALLMISAATPIYITNKAFACNLIYAFFFAVYNRGKITELPKFIKAAFVLITIGFITSSMNWTGGLVGSTARQGVFLYNFFWGPFFFLPLAFLKMMDSRDYTANFKGLLFCLILPSSFILFIAKINGNIVNLWEASLHVGAGAQGYYKYGLGRVVIDFTRTGIGFILAALICASGAILLAKVKGKYRLIAGACMNTNIYLLLTTGSFGSIFSCVCGLATIFFVQGHRISIQKMVVTAVSFLAMLVVVYNFAPPEIKEYIGKRYEHRVTKKDTDRVDLWSRAIDHLFWKPGGSGFTLVVGKKIKSNPHNDYLAYLVSYGFIGGIAYPLLFMGLMLYWYKNRKKKIDDYYALAVSSAGYGVTVALLLNSMTDNITANRWYFNVIWCIIWYCYFCSRSIPWKASKT